MLILAKKITFFYDIRQIVHILLLKFLSKHLSSFPPKLCELIFCNIAFVFHKSNRTEASLFTVTCYILTKHALINVNYSSILVMSCFLYQCELCISIKHFYFLKHFLKIFDIFSELFDFILIR